MNKLFYIILLIIALCAIMYTFNQTFVNNTVSLNKPSNQTFVNTSESLNKPSNQYREEILSESPKIIYLHNFITPEEAKFFIMYGDKNKKPSTIDTRDGGPVTLASDIRSSESAHIMKQSNPYASSIENKAAKYFSSHINNLEPLQVVVYEKGQKYVPHYDFFDPDTPDVSVRGNRSKTILVYLNDVPKESGGATFFPKLDLKIQPKAYDAIYFENMNNNQVDYNTLHSGEPIIGDIKKYAINIWLREKEF
jgi:prolyl 4-hydroxylase